MHILVTGICGFAGSEIARTLLEHREGISLAGLDNLSRKGSETNVESLRKLGVDVRIGDVRDRAFLETLPRADWILDCAANPSVLAGVDGSGSRDLVDQNLYGTVNLLELCKMWSAGFTLLSTSRVYSIPPLANLPLMESPTRFEPDLLQSSPITGFSASGIAESFSTAPPVSLYGSTKVCSEMLALEYGGAFGFPVWINRCGVLAGPGQFGKADQGIFSYWIHSWKSGRPLRYIGFNASGKQVRDCLHPRDIVPVLLKQMRQPLAVDPATRERPGFPKAQDSQNQHTEPASPSSAPVPLVAKESPRVFNLSGGPANSMSLLELSAWCRDRFGPSHSEFHISNSTLSESRPYDIPWLVLDSSLASNAWDWRPSTPVHGILEEIALHAAENQGWLDLVA